jgi:hypothetical protein
LENEPFGPLKKISGQRSFLWTFVRRGYGRDRSRGELRWVYLRRAAGEA